MLVLCESGNVPGVEAQTVTVCVLVLCESGNVPGVEAQTVTVCVGVV